MSSAAPTLEELIALAIQSGHQDIHVSMPGYIISYDAETQTAKVQPGIKRVIFDEDDGRVVEDLPPFENVPVCHYRCAALSIHSTLQAGDPVDLIFGSESMAEWRQGQSTGAVEPGDLKRLGLASPKAYPGLFPKNSPGPDTDNSIGTPGGLRVHFFEEFISVGTGAQFVALANLVKAELDKIQATLATGSVAAAPGPVVFGTPYTASAVSSSNLKAD